MGSPHVVVRVDAALSMAALLSQDVVIKLIKPNLGNMLRLFLKIMDEMELDELVMALKDIVEVYGEELAPYAVSLCHKLAEAYVRVLSS